jgi:diaminopimelate epimerase
MGLRFTKMHGLGNDFVVLDARESPLTLDIACIRAIADRHTGVGFDQMMILEPARDAACLAAYTIRFPQGANACFVRVVDKHFVKLRVHERGAGWTLACGSGVCATVAALHRRGRVGDEVRVEMPGGTLTIAWQGPGHVLSMTGPAAFPFDGEWLGS